MRGHAGRSMSRSSVRGGMCCEVALLTPAVRRNRKHRSGISSATGTTPCSRSSSKCSAEPHSPFAHAPNAYNPRTLIERGAGAMPLNRKVRYGMVGGGPGAFIGAVHRKAAALDGEIELVAGAFSSDATKSRKQGEELHLDSKRVYGSFKEMA